MGGGGAFTGLHASETTFLLKFVELLILSPTVSKTTKIQQRSRQIFAQFHKNIARHVEKTKQHGGHNMKTVRALNFSQKAWEISANLVHVYRRFLTYFSSFFVVVNSREARLIRKQLGKSLATRWT